MREHAPDVPATREGEPPHPADERALVRRVQRDGDMEAFEVIYRRYVEPIRAFAYRRSGSAALADDVTSSTFEKALRGIGTFRWRAGGLRPWLYRIASNELVSSYRTDARARRPDPAPSPEADDPSDQVISSDEAARIRDALSQLRPRYQQAITLRYLSGMTNREAARAMGVTPTTMAVLMHRALGAIRKVMEAPA